MTAWSAAELLAEAAAAGAARVLSKPIPPQLLLEALAAALPAMPVVLVIDDDPAFRRTLGDLLAARGIASATADSLVTALALLRGAAPRVILLDLKLDDRDPRETIRSIRQAAPAIPLVVYSGHPDALDAAVASLPSNWFRAVLRKPFLPERLFEVLDDQGHR
jgi:CheY-like chemotaxis protein